MMRTPILPVLFVTVALWLLPGTTSFTPTVTTPTRRHACLLQASLAPQSTSEALQQNINEDYILTPEQVHPVVTLGSPPKQKIINPFGFWCLAVSLVVCPIWYLALQLTQAVYKINDSWDPHREFFDGVGKIWAKSFLFLTNSYPTFSGELDILTKDAETNKPCLFVANHASWLDIPVLCTCTDRVFKFIAKGELAKLPCIGDQLRGVSSCMTSFEIVFIKKSLLVGLLI